MSAGIYRPDIQGLRAIAVLAVMAFHFNPEWLPGGFVGVDVFLVISGFLIGSILLRKKAQPGYKLSNTLKVFYTSRLKRIAPAYFVMLLLVTLVAAVFFIPKDFDTFKDGLEKAAWFNSNNYFAGFGNYFAPANYEQPLLHTWSLAVEVQFYLLAPLLILLLTEEKLKWVLWLLVIALTLVAEYRLRIMGIEQATYYSLYARLPEFFTGCLAAVYISTGDIEESRLTPWLSGLGLVLILVAAIAQPSLGNFPGIAALLPILGSVLVLVNTRPSVTSCFLSSKGLVWVGALSYSLYLWHWPVLAFLRYYSGTELLDMPTSVLFVVLTASCSIASYLFIEKPMRRKGRSWLIIMNYTVLALLVFGTSQSMAKVNEVLTPEQLPIEYRRYADPDTICHGKIVGDCLRGDLNSDREILVLGDSHAAMLNHFFDYLGKELGFKARIITASSCVTIPEFDYERIPEWARQSCLDQIEMVESFAGSVQPIFIAGMWSFQAKSDDFNSALGDFFHSHLGKRIFVLSQVPNFKHNVERERRFEKLGLPSHNSRSHGYQLGNSKINALAKHHENVKWLSLSDLAVFDSAPWHQGRLMYSDAHHLNEFGARIYAVEAASRFGLHNSIFSKHWFSINQ